MSDTTIELILLAAVIFAVVVFAVVIAWHEAGRRPPPKE